MFLGLTILLIILGATASWFLLLAEKERLTEVAKEAQLFEIEEILE